MQHACERFAITRVFHFEISIALPSFDHVGVNSTGAGGERFSSRRSLFQFVQQTLQHL